MLTVRTANATVDDLSEQDYRDLYHELRGYDADAHTFAMSLRGFADFLQSSMSHAVWAKYDKQEASLTRRMKNELRQRAGLPLLPPTIEEAMHDVSEDAAVAVLAGTVGDLDQVVLGNRSDPRWGLLQRRDRAPVRQRPKAVRPVVAVEAEERRRKLGIAWKDVIEAGLAALEAAGPGDEKEQDEQQEAADS